MNGQIPTHLSVFFQESKSLNLVSNAAYIGNFFIFT